MKENEGNIRRWRDENDNAHEPEQETIGMGEAAEKIIAATNHTGLKIGEAKEKLVVSKDNKKLQTDRKSANFHREKRNNRLQADRLSDTTDSEPAEDNDTPIEIENTDSEKSEITEIKESEIETAAKVQRKKTLQRKMRERMHEQKQRAFSEERHDPKNSYSHYYNDDFTDFTDFEDYGDNDVYENYDAPPSTQTTDNNADITLSHNKDDTTNKDKTKDTASRKDNRAKLFQADNSNKFGKLNHNTKTQGLKHEKNELKLKTDKKDSLDITLNKTEDKLERKQRKLRKRQRNNLSVKKYNLKNARLTHASAISKLIINSGKEKNNQTPVYTGQSNTGQGQDYAEQEQENLNKNLTNVISSSLKSTIADFENFEANLFTKDYDKASQNKFTKKKQRKEQLIKRKAKKEEERKSESIKRENEIKAIQTEKSEKLKHENKNDKGDNAFDSISNGKNDNTDYSLNNRKNSTAFNKRDNNESGVSLTKRNNGINKAKTTTNEKPIKDTKADTIDAKDNKPSRLKHDKTPHNRKSDTTATTSEKLKFSKENVSWHEHKEEKLRHNRYKGNTRENANGSLASNKDREQRKKLQKKSNKKALQKKAIKNQKKLSENSLKFAKRAGKATAKQTLEAVKFLARLVLKKIVALILFLISKIAIIGTLIMILIIIIALIGVIFLGTTGTMLLSTYLSDDETLSQVSVYYSDKERDLTNSLTENAIKTTYNVDEVNYVFVDNIGHSSHYLLSYLTAKYQNFTFDQVQSELDTIFGLQYTKTVTVRTVEIPILDDDGEPTEEFETRRIADITLTNNGFYDILYSRLSSDEREHFLLLLETTGNRQYGDFPMSWDWLINITEDFSNQNNGVEAEVPVNTAVYGTINGEVVIATADSVSIQGSIGEEVIIITFSRLNSVAVSVGDTVQMTTIVGYTSDRIFIQIQRNGVYVNPVLFLGSQRQDLVYGTSIPPLTQSEFNTLRDYARTAIGTPYVFGGTGPPPRGIDCSGFIWWAYNGSGIKSWGRTTAQGQFNQCDPITLADARPGDIIFFQGTYDTQDSRIVTHIGIYLGNGQMQHSGTPNQITSINSAYWQNHFYSFGRLRR